MILSEINTFHNVCKSKISFMELYEFIRHIHECQFNFVKLYQDVYLRYRSITKNYIFSVITVIIYSCIKVRIRLIL